MSRYRGRKICGSQQQTVFYNGDGEQQKSMGLDWQKNNFAPASRFFVHFVTVVA